MSVEVESRDVINLIQQFLKESKLTKTLQALQEETGVTFNSVTDLDVFIENVHNGHWDSVVQAIHHFKISNNCLIDLFEQIIIELIEMRELSTARFMLRKTDPLDLMKHSLPDRYLKLENLISKTYFDPKEAYPTGSNKEKRRWLIASELKKEVVCIEPSRLLTLLGQALKWQKNQGLIPPEAKVDLISGKIAMKELVSETFPTSLGLCIKFPSQTFAKVVTFSGDGQYMVSGSSDGFIEVWNYMTGKLRQDLKYQALENFMIMENPVTSLVFGESDLLASGDSRGLIKVWRVETGQCVKRFDNAHNQSITCLLFSITKDHLFSGSTDCLIRCHSLKSGSILKEFSGHESFVNSICYSHDGHNLISTGSDGSIRIWSIKNADCLKVFRITIGSADLNLAVNVCLPVLQTPDTYIVCNRSHNLYILNKNGQIVKSYNNGRNDEGGDFSGAFLSPKGNWAYALTQDGTMYCLDLVSGIYQHHMKVQDSEVISFAHHPHLNQIATCGTDGSVNIWK